MCEKTQPNAEPIKQTVEQVVGSNPVWNTGNLIKLFEWGRRGGIKQVERAATVATFQYATDTLDKGGGCGDQAVLVYSLIKSSGGNAMIGLDKSCEHAFALAYAASDANGFEQVKNEVKAFYSARGIKPSVFSHYVDSNGAYWIVVDTAAGQYLSDVYPGCQGTSFQPVTC